MTEVRKSTTWSGLGILVIVIALIAVVAYVIMNPSILENLLYIIIIVAIALVLIAVIAALVMGLLAVPYYMAKGETHQTDTSYDIADVKPVMDKKEPVTDSNSEKTPENPEKKNGDLDDHLY
jgi:glucan phosphoethanolaminetransferase (alkaline phosphatase superfamily)